MPKTVIAPQTRRRRRRRRGSNRRQLLWLVVALCIAGVSVGTTAQRVRQRRIATAAEAAQDLWNFDDIADSPAAQPARLVYRYSVVPGGVYSATELSEAVKRDPVVDALYRTVSERGVRLETVPANRLAYMSYRIGDQVYWSKHQIALHRGEAILTDGVTTIRGRCGNGISLDPMLPTSEEEPAPVELEALSVGESSLLPSHRLSFELAVMPGGQSPGLRSLDDLGFAFETGGPFGAPSSSEIAPALLPGTAPEGPTSPFPSDTTSLGTPTIPGVPPITDGPPLFPPDGPPLGPPGGPPTPPGSPTPTPNPPGGPPDVPPVPEPGTLLLVGGGLAMAIRRLRSRRP
jgi:hypothetical protein